MSADSHYCIHQQGYDNCYFQAFSFCLVPDLVAFPIHISPSRAHTHSGLKISLVHCDFTSEFAEQQVTILRTSHMQQVRNQSMMVENSFNNTSPFEF